MTVETEKLLRVYDITEGVFLEIGPNVDNSDYIGIEATSEPSKQWFGPVGFSASKEYMLALGKALIEAAKP